MRRVRMTEADYLDACDMHCGVCMTCGYNQGGCEPDARNYTCECCGETEVFGVEELMVSGRVEIVDEAMTQAAVRYGSAHLN